MDDIDNCFNNLNIEVNQLLLPNELEDKYKGNNCLKFLCINIRSLPKHLDDLSNLLSSLNVNFSCIVLTETYLKDHNKDLYSLPDFDSFNICRKIRKGGGVTILIKKSLSAKEICTVNNLDTEAIGVTFKEGSKTFNLLGVYRPPQGSRLNFIRQVDELCNSPLKNGVTVIAGDFNIDVSSYNSSSYGSKLLINTMKSNGYLNYITGITRPNEHNNPTTIDHMWSNNRGSTKSYTLNTDLSDHYPCILSFETSIIPLAQKKIEYRVISEDRKKKFLNQIKNTDYSFVHRDTLSIDEKFKNFSSIMYNAYDRNFPIRTKTVTEKRMMNKWLTKALLTSIREKHRLYKSAKSGTIPMQTYTDYSSMLKKLIRKSKTTFFEDKFKQNQSNPRTQWGIVNDILNRCKRTHTEIKELKVDDEIITNRQDIVNELNSYFTTIGATLAAEIPVTEVPFDDYLRPHHGPSFTFDKILTPDVECVINGLKNKCTDLLSVPNWIYKFCKKEISPILATLYNSSLEQNWFPTELKIARVTPVPKITDASSPNNFRPISILHTIGKILEKLVHTQLTNYLHENGLLSTTQFGFTKNRNTEDALIYLTEKIYKALNAKQTCVLLLLDFSKAFDVVSHDILLSKFMKLGINNGPLSWIRSYLSDRTQYVRLKDTSSTLVSISQGVPQGSILGPLFFNIYTNDFQNCHGSIHSQYADDTAILISDRNINTLNHKVNQELKNVITWVEANRLAINLQKTNYIVITNQKNPVQLNVKAQDITINRIKSAKLLGVIFDEKLSFKEHINNLVSKLSYASYAFLKIKNFIPRYILKNLYYSLVYPHLLYCLPVWGCASEYLLQPLIILQKKIIRRISGSQNYYAHTTPLFKNLLMLKLQDIYTLSVSNHIYKITNGTENELLNNIILANQTVRSNNLRSTNSLTLKKSNFTLTKSRRAVSYKGIEAWNNLPKTVQESPSIGSFRKSVKNYLLSKY